MYTASSTSLSFDITICNTVGKSLMNMLTVDCDFVWEWHGKVSYTAVNSTQTATIFTHTRCQQVDNYSMDTWTTFTVTVTIKQTTQMPFIRWCLVELLWSRYTEIMQCGGGKTSSDGLLGGMVSERITAADLKSGWRLGIHISVQLFGTWLRVISCMLRSFINFLLHFVINCLCAHQQITHCQLNSVQSNQQQQ